MKKITLSQYETETIPEKHPLFPKKTNPISLALTITGIVLAIAFIVFFCYSMNKYDVSAPYYLGKNPELYTIVTHNAPGAQGRNIETEIIETDSYGRVLFKLRTEHTVGFYNEAGICVYAISGVKGTVLLTLS